MVFVSRSVSLENLGGATGLELAVELSWGSRYRARVGKAERQERMNEIHPARVTKNNLQAILLIFPSTKTCEGETTTVR